MRALYDSKSKTISDRGVKAILSDSEKWKSWLLVEAELAKAQAEEGFIPERASEGNRQASRF